MKHKNFIESSEIDALLTRYDAEKPPLVAIMQYSGGMSFHHSMTPVQARDLAADLLALADEAEGKGKTA